MQFFFCRFFWEERTIPTEDKDVQIPLDRYRFTKTFGCFGSRHIFHQKVFKGILIVYFSRYLKKLYQPTRAYYHWIFGANDSNSLHLSNFGNLIIYLVFPLWNLWPVLVWYPSHPWHPWRPAANFSLNFTGRSRKCPNQASSQNPWRTRLGKCVSGITIPLSSWT